MSSKTSILFLGATGYVGGSVLTFLASHPKASDFDITLYVRSAEKARKLEDLNLGLKTIPGTLEELEAAAAKHDITFNCAASDDLPVTEAILRGAKVYRETTGKPVTLIHVSGSGIVIDNALGQFASEEVFDDLDNDKLNALPVTQWHRHVDIPIIDAAKEGHVKSYLVSPGFVHGLATGKLVEAGIINPVPTVLLGVAMGALGSGQGRLVGPQKNIWHAVHIDDLVGVFQIIFNSILEGKTIPSGPEGYYFVENGIIPTLDIVKKTVEVLHDLGKINTLELREWTNDELFASNSPLPYFGTNSRIKASKIRQFGWNPTHESPKGYLDGVKQEIEVMFTQELGKGFASHRV